MWAWGAIIEATRKLQDKVRWNGGQRRAKWQPERVLQTERHILMLIEFTLNCSTDTGELSFPHFPLLLHERVGARYWYWSTSNQPTFSTKTFSFPFPFQWTGQKVCYERFECNVFASRFRSKRIGRNCFHSNRKRSTHTHKPEQFLDSFLSAGGDSYFTLFPFNTLAPCCVVCILCFYLRSYSENVFNFKPLCRFPTSASNDAGYRMGTISHDWFHHVPACKLLFVFSWKYSRKSKKREKGRTNELLHGSGLPFFLAWTAFSQLPALFANGATCCFKWNFCL